MKQKILNLTQHVMTPEQEAQGVFEPEIKDKKKIQKLLTFDEIPTSGDMSGRQEELARIVEKYNPDAIMIGGAPYFMHRLEGLRCHLKTGGKVLYAFSKRKNIDQPQPDGSVKKVTVFKHCGFVEV